MSDTHMEGVAPGSAEDEAIKALQEEGHEIGSGEQPLDTEGNVIEKPIEKTVEVKKEEEKVDPPKKDEPIVEPKPNRSPTMVEAWKLKVAEDQKGDALKKVTDLESKIEELSKQKGPITQTQQEDISDLVKEFAEESGMSEDSLKKFTEGITKSIESKFKPSEETTKNLESFKIAQTLAKEEAEYSKEFDKDVLPLLKEYNLSDEKLSELRSGLKDLAFSETYAKVPLKEIFKIKGEAFDLKVPRQSSEGKPGVKVRADNDVVDYDNMDEDTFSKLSPEQVTEFEKHKSGSWNKK